MKHYTILILLYIAQAIGYYLLFAFIGLIWSSWYEVVNSFGFNMVYWMFISWWIPVPVCIEYYEEYIED